MVHLYGVPEALCIGISLVAMTALSRSLEPFHDVRTGDPKTYGTRLLPIHKASGSGPE